MTPTAQKDPSRRKITMERNFEATLKEVWELWTTKEGIESWWGPEGFVVKVRKLDLRPGGELLYDMCAVGKDQVAFMKKAGMPTETPAKIVFSEVIAEKRLAYLHLTDFIPNVEPYNVETVVELHPTPEGVRMALIFEAMHSDEWTQRAVMGWEGELGKLGRVIEKNKSK